MRFPGLPKRNPGLELANAFSVILNIPWFSLFVFRLVESLENFQFLTSVRFAIHPRIGQKQLIMNFGILGQEFTGKLQDRESFVEFSLLGE
jgi:hypothetical protein